MSLDPHFPGDLRLPSAIIEASAVGDVAVEAGDGRATLGQDAGARHGT